MRRRPNATALLLLLIFTILLAAPAATLADTPDVAGPAWLGVTLGGAPRPSDRPSEEGSRSGVTISGIVAGSPAHEAGLRGRDRILAVDGEAVTSASDLVARISSKGPGSWVTLSVVRRGRDREIRARLTERSATERLRVLQGWIGVSAIDLPSDLREHFGAPRDAGVMIAALIEGSPAEAAGLHLGDVVFEIEGEPVRSPGALRYLISTSGIGDPVEVRLMRDGAEITLEPRIGDEPAAAERD